MPRYAIRSGKSRAQDMWSEDSLVPSLTVDDHESVDTGLIASTGEPIMRLPNPIGFGRDGEW